MRKIIIAVSLLAGAASAQERGFSPTLPFGVPARTQVRPANGVPNNIQNSYNPYNYYYYYGGGGVGAFGDGSPTVINGSMGIPGYDRPPREKELPGYNKPTRKRLNDSAPPGYR